ncbi:hypothetical protein [Labrenzia sp. CE80]|uniref:DUF7662 domain-containing protein n=1 Tax=Labrenzia sp. CE80 TaxID=1788986 RepID=UPI00129BE0B5|nr:hypothetical protein [Labrenzia sp. CE80]
MSKYDPLREHLARLEDVVWAAKLGDLESILGSGLPKSAREHRTWWANSGGSLVHQNSWLDAGWRVERTDLPRDVVVFRRRRIAGTSLAVSSRTSANKLVDGANAGERRLAKEMAALRQPVTVTLRAEWTALGAVHKVPCSAAAIPADAGVARIVYLDGDQPRSVIIETTNIQLFYRTLRLELKAASEGGQEQTRCALWDRLGLNVSDPMEFDLIRAGNAWLLTDGRGRKADLEVDEERGLVAQLLVLQERQAGIPTSFVGL